MTVAAVVLAASPASALEDADGLPSVRRIADVAWSGGAIPIVVVADDPGGDVATALAGASVVLADPAPRSHGPAGQMVRGAEVALAEVSETTAILVWPARYTWVGPETVTSMIEAHGVEPDVVLRPSHGDITGWPVLVPVVHLDRLRAVGPERDPVGAIADLVAQGVLDRRLPLGDPGVARDLGTPRSDLPPYDGPPVPPPEQAHEWGAAVADEPEDAPLAPPTRVPYPPD